MKVKGGKERYDKKGTSYTYSTYILGANKIIHSGGKKKMSKKEYAKKRGYIAGFVILLHTDIFS